MVISLDEAELEHVLHALSQFLHNAEFRATHDKIREQIREQNNPPG